MFVTPQQGDYTKKCRFPVYSGRGEGENPSFKGGREGGENPSFKGDMTRLCVSVQTFPTELD